MTKILTALALTLTLALGGCVTDGLTSGLGALIKTVENPVRSIDIYRVKNVYAASLELAAKYRQVCWSKPYAALMAEPVTKSVCQNRRAVVRNLKIASDKAGAAITAADRFVRENPTLNAATAINAAWKAVTDFQSLATSVTR